MRFTNRLVLLTTVPLLIAALPVRASAESTFVDRGFTHTLVFADDICGLRSGSVTWTYTVSQSHLVERADGTFAYRDVSVTTYVVDFDDPALADYSGRSTEVNNYILTPGENRFIASNTFYDIGGELKIWERLNLKVAGDDVLVDRFLLKATGCP